MRSAKVGVAVSAALLASLVVGVSGVPAAPVPVTTHLPRCDASTLKMEPHQPLFLWGSKQRYHKVLWRFANVMVIVDVLTTCVSDDWRVSLAVAGGRKTFLTRNSNSSSQAYLGSGPYPAGERLQFILQWKWHEADLSTPSGRATFNGLELRIPKLMAWAGKVPTWRGPERVSLVPHSSIPNDFF